MRHATTSYDELWRTVWGDMQRLGPVHRHIQEQVARIVAQLEVVSVLDVGCGSGDNLATLRPSGYELTGVEVSTAALEIARQRVPGARLTALDIERDVLPEQFDLVMSVQVLEHLVDDLAALRNMARMARRYVLISTISGRMRPSEVSIGHVRNYSRTELGRKLRLAGLEPIWMRGWGFPFYSPLYRSAVEWLPSGPPAGRVNNAGRLAASSLYWLYRLNSPTRGDVLTALAAPQ